MQSHNLKGLFVGSGTLCWRMRSATWLHQTQMALLSRLQFPRIIRSCDKQTAIQAPGLDQCRIQHSGRVLYRMMLEIHDEAAPLGCDAELQLLASACKAISGRHIPVQTDSTRQSHHLTFANLNLGRRTKESRREYSAPCERLLRKFRCSRATYRLFAHLKLVKPCAHK